jgi:hypothetical protein
MALLAQELPTDSELRGILTSSGKITGFGADVRQSSSKDIQHDDHIYNGKKTSTLPLSSSPQEPISDTWEAIRNETKQSSVWDEVRRRNAKSDIEESTNR